MANKIHLSSSPHFTEGLNTSKIMLAVIISLIPECIAGVIFFGIQALISILISVASCLFFEFLFQKCTKQEITLKNCSAIVSGLLIALVCPPSIPWWMLVIASAIAMVFAKGVFGGIGSNVFNPALTGRAVLFISFPAAMGARWTQAFSPDAVSSATTLSALKTGSISSQDINFMDYFLGARAGCIGETSILLICISFIFLLSLKIIDWRAPAGMVGTVIVLAFISGLISYGNIIDAGKETLVNLLTGGLLFGACFMVTDYATAPVTKPGRIVFGVGCGLITFLIRKFGGYPEGVMFSILIMNSVAPFLNNLTVRMYGYGKKGNTRADVSKINMTFDLSNAKLRQGGSDE